MPVGVPAKEQLRADIDKIIRRAAKGLPPKKRGVAHIIQVKHCSRNEPLPKKNYPVILFALLQSAPHDAPTPPPQWETLPQLPQERTKNTGPIWSVPKVLISSACPQASPINSNSTPLSKAVFPSFHPFPFAHLALHDQQSVQRLALEYEYIPEPPLPKPVKPPPSPPPAKKKKSPVKRTKAPSGGCIIPSLLPSPTHSFSPSSRPASTLD